LTEELKELQGQLGDLNMLIEKIHTNGELEELNQSHQLLKARNQTEFNKLDDQRQRKWQ
jgi:hypothetical protein